jgi:hypothetical protein
MYEYNPPPPTNQRSSYGSDRTSRKGVFKQGFPKITILRFVFL